jgi:hypothetical protein
MGSFNDFMHDNYNYSIKAGGLQQVPIEIQKAKENSKTKLIKKKPITILPKIVNIVNLPASLIGYLFEKGIQAFKKSKAPVVKKSVIEEIQHTQKKKSVSPVVPKSTFMVDEVDKKVNAKCGLLDLESKTWSSLDDTHLRFPINNNLLSSRLNDYIVVKLYEKINNPEFEYIGDSRIDSYPIYAYKGNKFLSYDLIYEEIVSV